MKTRNLAVMLTDIKGFTDRISQQSRSQMRDLLEAHRELVMPVIEKYHGNIIKTIGDAFLVTFESPTDAVLCGVAVQDSLREYNETKNQDERIDVRIAINAGEVSIADDGDIFGDAVNITSRIESIAEAGEVFFTEAVYLAMNKKEVPSSEIGLRQFKGVPEKIKVYKVLRETPIGHDIPSSAAYAPPGEAPAGFGRRPPASPAGVQKDAGTGESIPPGGTPGKSGTEDENICDISGNGLHIRKNGKEIKIGKDGIEITKGGKKIRIDKKGGVETFSNIFGGGGKPTDKSARNGTENEVPAGFFRRFGALLLDLLIFSIIAGLLLPGSMIRVKKNGKPSKFNVEIGESGIKTNNIDIHKGGINIKGNGKSIRINKTGIRIIKNGKDIITISKDGKKIGAGKNSGDGAPREGGTAPAAGETAVHQADLAQTNGDISIEIGRKRRGVPLKLILWILYGTIFLKGWGATPGKMILHLKVVDAAGRAALKTRQALLRSLFSVISAIPLCLGYLWAAWEGNTKTWHDIVAGTSVIKS